MDGSKAFGFSLLEVLVALAIVAIGALGFTKAQVNALRSISDAMTRTVANILVQDMIARIESNPEAAWLATTGTAFLNPGTLDYSGCINNTTICTGNEMAAHDVADWKALVADAFPVTMQAKAIVCLENTPGTIDFTRTDSCSEVSTNFPVVYTVKIFWKSSGSTGAYDQAEVGTIQPPLVRTPMYPLPDTDIRQSGPDGPLLRGDENCSGTSCS